MTNLWYRVGALAALALLFLVGGADFDPTLYWLLPPLVGQVLLTEVNTIATKTIMPGVVDNFFRAGPVMAFLKSRFNRRWAGPQIQENYLYRPMRGGSYAKGSNFNTNPRQTFTGMQFTPRYYYVNVTEFLEDLEVEMAGPTAMFSKLTVDLQNAAFTMSAQLEIAIFHHGQNIGGDDRTQEINGLEEALNDGTNAGWGGDVFTQYGGQVRADVNNALNSPVGAQAANVNGGVSFATLQRSLLSCVVGGEAPSIGVTSNRGFSFISEAFHPSQRIDAVQPEINWPGMKFPFNNATIVMSQYIPGQDGVNDADLGNYNNGSELLLWLNPGPRGEMAYARLYIAQSRKFAMGFTGFKGARDDNQVSGQILFGGNFTYRAPRYSRILYGITS